MAHSWAHYDTFRDQLTLAHPAFGHALWEPDPGEFPPVEIGDVGFIRNGKFHRLFNALLPAHHPSHESHGVPEGYEQLQLRFRDHIDRGVLRPNNFYSHGVTIVSGGLEALATGLGSAEVSFSCARKNGAVLTLPVTARREDTLAQAHFRKWITRHIGSWFAFTQELGMGIEMEDIVLVTGCHRTSSWSNIAFNEVQADARVSLGVVVAGVLGASVSWRVSRFRIQGAVHGYRTNGENLPEDQCIFIRGFRVKRVFGIYPWIRAAAEPKPDTPERDREEPESEVVPIPSVTEYRDPLHVLLEYIARREPNCDLALVHDDDLERVLGVGGMTSMETLQTDAIMNYLEESKLEIGVISEPFGNDRTPRTDKELMTVAMITEQPKSSDPPASAPLPSHISTPSDESSRNVPSPRSASSLLPRKYKPLFGSKWARMTIPSRVRSIPRYFLSRRVPPQHPSTYPPSEKRDVSQVEDHSIATSSPSPSSPQHQRQHIFPSPTMSGPHVAGSDLYAGPAQDPGHPHYIPNSITTPTSEGTTSAPTTHLDPPPFAQKRKQETLEIPGTLEIPFTQTDNPYLPLSQQNIRLALDPNDPAYIPPFPALPNAATSAILAADPTVDDGETVYEGDDMDDSSSEKLVPLEESELPTYFEQIATHLDFSFHTVAMFFRSTPTKLRDTQHILLRMILGSNYDAPVRKLLKSNPGGSNVVDLCTGAGHWVLEMAEEFPRVKFRGVDLVPIQTRYPPDNVLFEIGDVAERLSFLDASVDVVHARMACLSADAIPGFLREVARILRPGGLFLSADWDAHPTLHPRHPSVERLEEHIPKTITFYDVASTVVPTLAPSIATLIRQNGSFGELVSRRRTIPISAPHEAGSSGLSFVSEVMVRTTKGYADALVAAQRVPLDVAEDFKAELSERSGIVCVYQTVFAHKKVASPSERGAELLATIE